MVHLCLWNYKASFCFVVVVLMLFKSSRSRSNSEAELPQSMIVKRSKDVTVKVTQSHTTQITAGLDSTMALPKVCHRRCSHSLNGTKTSMFCENDELKMEGRCCVNTTKSSESSTIFPVLGIDLQNCSLTEEEFAAVIQNLSILVVISLEGNPLEKVTPEDFNQNTDIIYLSLPVNISCPGGKDAWGDITVDRDATYCKDELNTCKYKNVTCPDNSHCVPSGVTFTWCRCNEGYHGYKCLNKGTFPFIPYAAGIAGPTIVLSLLLWCTQRRYVKPKSV